MSTDGKTEPIAPGRVDPGSVTADDAGLSYIHAADGGTVDLPPEEMECALSRSRCELEIPPGLRPPLAPAGYELVSKLGEGTYGEVWRGRHARTGVQVAVKFLHARPGASVHGLGAEARKLAMLHGDPRIVQLMDVEEQTTPPYFVMDYAEHGSLAARLEKGPLPLATALPLFRQVVEALAYVHAKGVRHCDLKPGNILLDAADRPRVADFGQSHLSVEPTHAALGTFFYMAPEQALAERRVADPRWDVFGLGALLYAMLTGSPPRSDPAFRAELEATAELSHRLERYRRWVETGPAPAGHRAIVGMDRALAEIIDRCLAADPARRYADAGELLRALDRRDRRRQRRPLVIFATVAPLLLVTALGVAGLIAAHTANDAVTDARDTLKRHKDRVDRTTARLVADIVKDKLQDLRDKADVLARNDRLRDPYLRFLAAPTDANRQALEDFLARVGRYESYVHLIAVYDTTGNLRAAWMRSDDPARQHPRETYGRNYAFRDYWNHRGDDFGPSPPVPYVPYTEGGRVVPFIGQPHTSTVAEKFAGISVSRPIYRHDDHAPGAREFAGLLVAYVKLDKFNDWLRTADDSDACVVVLDNHGYCVHHRPECRTDYEPRDGANPARRNSPVYERVLRGEEGIAEHQDPFDGRRYSAAFIPVQPFGWGVIVQQEVDNDLARVRDRVEGELAFLVGVAVVLSLTLLAVFWGWLLWTLLRKEAAAHA